MLEALRSPEVRLSILCFHDDATNSTYEELAVCIDTNSTSDPLWSTSHLRATASSLNTLSPRHQDCPEAGNFGSQPTIHHLRSTASSSAINFINHVFVRPEAGNFVNSIAQPI